jgi:uncharacterized damage-inducible protein DinB
VCVGFEVDGTDEGGCEEEAKKHVGTDAFIRPAGRSPVSGDRVLGKLMTDLEQTIASGLTARYKKLAGIVHELAALLSDEQLWAKPFVFGNSFGHLLLHLTGNLNYYVGAQIAGTGYVRDRPLEFSDAARPSKKEVLEKFDDAIEMVLAAISRQSTEDWSKEYTAVAADARDRFDMVLQCATHLHHHIGQMMYLVFELKRTAK